MKTQQKDKYLQMGIKLFRDKKSFTWTPAVRQASRERGLVRTKGQFSGTSLSMLKLSRVRWGGGGWDDISHPAHRSGNWVTSNTSFIFIIFCQIWKYSSLSSVLSGERGGSVTVRWPDGGGGQKLPANYLLSHPRGRRVTCQFIIIAQTF